MRMIRQRRSQKGQKGSMEGTWIDKNGPYSLSSLRVDEVFLTIKVPKGFKGTTI